MDPENKSTKIAQSELRPLINPIISSYENFKKLIKNSLLLYYHNALQNDKFPWRTTTDCLIRTQCLN